jgi:prepilin-type processing-associated H-X9-DG protein
MQLRAFIGFGLLSVLALGIAARQVEDTPEGCVRAFLDALSAKDVGKAMGLIAGGKTIAPGTPNMLTQAPGLTYQLKSAKTFGEGDDVVVTAELGLASDSSAVINDVFHLKKVDGHWRIVPLNIVGQTPPPSLIAAILAMTAAPQSSAATASSSTVCISNMKQLALAGIMYSNDYDDRLPASDNWKSVEMPYIKNTSIFHCPDDPRAGAVSYRMSDFISRALMSKIAEPAATVLDYEGQDGYLVARHTNRGSVAYTDGHAKLVSPDVFRSGYHKP